MAETRRHPRLFEPGTLLFGAGLALLGAIIGMELLTRVGISANSSIIAAVLAIAVGRVPLALTRRFRNTARQNLLQTVISAATFGGANAVLLPAGMVWLFGSRVFPAEGLWPSGIATAECLRAGDEGGRRAALLITGGAAGVLGRLGGIPTDIVGVCWIGNQAALLMFGLGLLARGYAPQVLGLDLAAVHAPHGIMIGAGAVALWQMGRVIRGHRESASPGAGPRPGLATFAKGYSGFAAAAALVAVLGGLLSGMGIPGVVAFALFAAGAALVSELLCGVAAMHSGWFPAFATSLIFLLLGMLLGFPPLALVLLTGFASATGPAFADMGYDLKAGWILRGEGKDPDYERRGRAAQRGAEVFGLLVASGLVLLTYASYFEANLFPPYDRVAVATIAAGQDPGLARELAVWAVPGAILQFLGGPGRQMGVLFATGLLVVNPVAGWTALAALLVRRIVSWRTGDRHDALRYIVAGGMIAGSALTSFSSGVASGMFGRR